MPAVEPPVEATNVTTVRNQSTAPANSTPSGNTSSNSGGSNYCPSCGEENISDGNYCSECGKTSNQESANVDTVRGKRTGTRQDTYKVKNKNPSVALVLSLIIIGLGQFYNGEFQKAIGMFVTGVIAGVLSFGVLWFGVAIWSAIDAYNVAKGTEI